MDRRKASDILEGVLRLACRLSHVDQKQFRIKDVSGSGTIDSYISIQNVDAIVGTKKAIGERLIRRTFGIYQASQGSPVVLRILESDANKGDTDYRSTWERPAEDMSAWKEMANLLAQSIQELGSAFSK
ncbi:MAG: hypothetical protein Q7T81_17615 [Pseudolabrys sp.]|nr:hypothetical protein [Pseudolabrys sp.]